MDQWQYLKHTEDAYKAQCKVTGVVGLYLTAPFAKTVAGTDLADEIRKLSRTLEEKIRELYKVEKEVEKQ